MGTKKIVISLLAIVSIFLALCGVWTWQQKQANLPVRQEQEIR